VFVLPLIKDQFSMLMAHCESVLETSFMPATQKTIFKLNGNVNIIPGGRRKRLLCSANNERAGRSKGLHSRVGYKVSSGITASAVTAHPR
jgi:hypothetical protein